MKFYILSTSVTVNTESGTTTTINTEHFMFTAVNRTVGNRMAARWAKKMGFLAEDVSFRLATATEKKENVLRNDWIPAGR